eukprot:PRCOL_00003582-RA
MVMGESDTVTKEDQAAINKFSQLNNRLSELELVVKAKREDLENFEEAGNELMLADDDETKYLMGEVFVTIANDAAEEKLQEATDAAQALVEEHEEEIEKIKGEMEDLKAKLKVKFGDSIQLEQDP